jgi:hypothetical protein
MKIEISIEKNGKGKEGEMDDMESELMDEQKMAIAKKIKKNIALTRMERTMLSSYLLEDKEGD